jgi:sigma-B regulation protein RsbU (phosphoserine phosphatase)
LAWLGGWWIPIVAPMLGLTGSIAAITAFTARKAGQIRIENLRLGKELEIIKQMQQMILPRIDELEEIRNLDISGFMEPADEVGGDYYDVLRNGELITIGIGDVTGHGLESGILMVMAQTAVRTIQEFKNIDFIPFLDTLNRTLYKNLQRMGSDKNLTLVLINYFQGEISISGQHEETIVVRKGGDIERVDTIDLGFPIGLEEEISDFISNSIIKLDIEDGIVLYTDGIPEAINMVDEQYGLERLCAIIQANWARTSEEIRDAVIDDLRKFIGKQKVFDDITLLVVKRKD